jgi:hypothetical protein
MGEKLDRLTAPPVCRNLAAFKVGTTFLQNPLRKNYMAFVKVVEGS